MHLSFSLPYEFIDLSKLFVILCRNVYLSSKVCMQFSPWTHKILLPPRAALGEIVAAPAGYFDRAIELHALLTLTSAPRQIPRQYLDARRRDSGEGRGCQRGKRARARDGPWLQVSGIRSDTAERIGSRWMLGGGEISKLGKLVWSPIADVTLAMGTSARHTSWPCTCPQV